MLSTIRRAQIGLGPFEHGDRVVACRDDRRADMEIHRRRFADIRGKMR